MTDVLSYDLRKLASNIPGYDPFETAAPGDWFDEDAARDVLEFFPQALTHVKGRWAGKPFELEPWEAAILVNLFGWKRDGTRRYRETLILVARKNGKSLLAAGIVLYMLYCDGEPGAELYSLAAEREQARLVFGMAAKMIQNSAELSKYATVQKYAIVVGDGSYKALSSEAGTKHGTSPHLTLNDELHAMRTRELVDAMATGVGARSQPLTVNISTSDYEREGSICNAKHDYATKVRDGIIEDHAFLPVIYEASREDDWTSPKTWAKANPNMGVSVTEEFLRAECARAQEDPTFENEFKRLYLNIRTQQAFRWMPMQRWDACDEPLDLDALKGCDCYGGLDLASVQDMASLVLDFQIRDVHHLLPFYFCPEETADIRERKEKQPYVTWSKAGLVTLTPGASIDYRYIRKRVNELDKIYKIRQIGYDPWNATQITQQLAEEDGIDMVEFRQGTVSMNAPMKQMMTLVIDRKVVHGGNKVLRWNMNNLAANSDPSGNVRPDKKHSFEKIDGAVASIMAIGMATAGGHTEEYYENHEVRFL